MPLETRSLEASCASPADVTRHHCDALLVYDEGIFIGAVRGTSIFNEPQTTGRQLVFNAVIEQDDAVSDVFLKSIARQRAVAPLAGDDGSHTFFFQPVE